MKRSGLGFGAGSAPRVLLADDHEPSRKILAKILSHAGFDVVEANDGLDAVQKFREDGDLKVVVIDVSMPHVNGDVALQMIRQLDPTVRAVVISGRDPLADTARDWPVRTTFLPKPFRAHMLISSLHAVFAGAS